MRFARHVVVAVVSCMAIGSVALGGEWPRFLGPAGTGVVEQGEKVNLSWPQGGPKELWKVDLGEGYGGPSIAGGKVFILDRKGNEADVFRVFDLKTGKSIWEHEYATAPFKQAHGGSRGTPTIDGGRAYTVGLTGLIHCFDVAAKQISWKKSLEDDFGVRQQKWGSAQSPLILRDMLIVAGAGGPHGLIALDKNSGETVWKTQPFGGDDTYTSPMVVTIDGQEQVINWHRGVLAAFDTKDGKPLWKYEWRTNRPIPQPVSLGDGRFFLTIGYGSGCAMIKAARGADGTWTATELFQDNRSGSKVPPALLYNGHIYTNSDDNKRGLQCLDAEGNVKWETIGRPEFGLGSMIIADGVIFILNGTTGDLVMAEANPKEYKELGRAKVLGGREIWAPLAISDGLLVVRDQSQMKCLSVGM